MVNVRAVANRATRGINPNLTVSLSVCTGYTTGHGFVRAATYAAPVDIVAQVQALSKEDVRHLDALGISDATRSLYCNRQLTAADRKTGSGGDKVRFTDLGTGATDTYMVMAILEGWSTAGWCRAGLVKQLDA